MTVTLTDCASALKMSASGRRTCQFIALCPSITISERGDRRFRFQNGE